MKVAKLFLWGVILFISSPNLGAKTILPTTETSIPLQFCADSHKLRQLPLIIISIKSKSIPVLLDTGTSDKIDLMLRPSVLHDLNVKFTNKKFCFNSSYGMRCEKEFIIPEVKIGSFIVRNVKGIEEPEMLKTKISSNGILGKGLLSKFNLLLDYKRSRIVLVKHTSKLISYDLSNWISFPTQTDLRTKLRLNGKTVTLLWDTGCTPSIIKPIIIKELIYQDHSYQPDFNASYFRTTLLTTMKDKKLPPASFLVKKLPSALHYDGAIGSNFYQKNLVYFDFYHHVIYVKPKSN